MLTFFTDRKNFFKIFADGVIWSLITIPAFWLRLEWEMFNYWPTILLVMLATAPIKYLAIYIFGHHRRSWQYSSMRDVFTLAASISAVTFIYFSATIVVRQQVFLPLSIPLIEALLAFIAMGGLRYFIRMYLKENYYQVKRTKQKRVIIAGAGDAGVMIAKEMQRHPEKGLKPVAFLDDAPHKWNQKVMGLTVEGHITDMKEVTRKYRAEEIIIAMSAESGAVIRRIVELARECGLNSRIMPALHDLISGKVSINQLREVDLEDLLRRKPVVLDTDKIDEYIRGRRVLVTGAGGSIGSEIVRQVSRFDPECIVLLGRGENSIYHIVREMSSEFPNIPIHIKIADVRDINTMETIFEEIHPEVIFHAAAHKHVPLMESNPAQAVFNNIGGTGNMAKLAVEYKVKYFVNISTDKAVNPTSVMGASKRIAEYLVEQAAQKAEKDQVFVSVRFGNVLGSRGSVIPFFRSQIQKGGPITITHPDMIRYFMTIPEASQLVLQAGALNQNGAVFVLDMGKPVRIQDMARDLIKLSGLEPDKDIEIKFTGIRPGEKLFEELLTAEEGTEVTKYEKIMVARKNGLPNEFDVKLDRLFETARMGDPNSIKAMIHDLVPTYVGHGKVAS